MSYTILHPQSSNIVVKRLWLWFCNANFDTNMNDVAVFDSEVLNKINNWMNIGVVHMWRGHRCRSGRHQFQGERSRVRQRGQQITSRKRGFCFEYIFFELKYPRRNGTTISFVYIYIYIYIYFLYCKLCWWD